MDGGGSGSRLNGGFRHRHAQNALCACITCSMRRPAPIFSAAFAALKTGAIFGPCHVASPCHAPGGQLAIGIMCSKALF